MVEGLYTGLGSGAALTATQLDAKMKLLVEAPAAVEDALASLLDHADATLQANRTKPCSRLRLPLFKKNLACSLFVMQFLLVVMQSVLAFVLLLRVLPWFVASPQAALLASQSACLHTCEARPHPLSDGDWLGPHSI